MVEKLRILKSLHDIEANVWDRLANPISTSFNPFVSHAFLLALEDSDSTGPKTGWAAHHLVLENDGLAIACCPCYLKSHSMGEYVFDHGWAEAYHRAGGQYYPKLQVSVPFTPASGPRLLARDEVSKKKLAEHLVAICDKSASSVHMTFLPEGDWTKLGGKDWLQRQDLQFHWHNSSYISFDDFLAGLSSSKRKNIRKERKAVLESGITFKHLTGNGLIEDHWDHFFAFYMDTGSRKWGKPYLTRKFFSLLNDKFSDQTLLVMAYHNDKMIAGALNFIGGDTLYGRNWGCLEDHPFLHFETCYYQAMDFAIARGLKTVEAGAQGEHKLARGYLPQKTFSLHHLAHPGLQRAVADYLQQERAGIEQEAQLLSEHSPFKEVE